MLKDFALAAMRLSFLEGADLADAAAVLEAGRRAGLDDGELGGAVATQAVKDALRSTTEEALALGVFGVPTVTVGTKLFWGDDRLEDAAGAWARFTEHEPAPSDASVDQADGERSISS
jgi:2-hydroxychromene-2-carboxylate isomerase